ncbi:MAG: hypothetical protein ACPGSD_00065 [Flavobacteriales bacterium]
MSINTDNIEGFERNLTGNLENDPVKDPNEISGSALEEEKQIREGQLALRITEDKHIISMRIMEAKLRIYEASREQEITELSTLNNQRKTHAGWALAIAFVWIAVIIAIIIMQGIPEGFNLDNTAFLTVIGTLTTSVFGFYLIVIKFLFSTPKTKNIDLNKLD